MRISRLRLRTSSLLTAVVCTAWLSACGDGDGTADPTAGTSGSGAAGGTGGKGGSAGKGGTAGKGGSAGNAGSNAGSSGSSGTGAGGDPGEGGTGAIGGEGAVSGQGAAGGQGATGGEGATAGEGATGGQGATSGEGGQGATAGDAGTGGQGDGGLGGEGGAPAGGAGGEPAVCELEQCGAECVDLDVGTASGNTVTDCGACDRSCSLANASASTCDGGECAPTCNVGFDDCVVDDGSGASDDGCETELALGNVAGPSVNDCGACGRDCSLDGAISSTCGAGLCQPVCADGRADCEADDGGEDDGCETAINTAASCGTTCDNLVTCEAENGCRSGVCEPSGLAVFTIPFTAASQIQRYAVTHSGTGMVNLTNDTVNVRLYAPGATAGTVNIYILDAAGPAGPGTIRELTTLNSGWVTVSIPVGVADGAEYDPGQIRQVTLDVSSGATGPWANPTIIYVDRIWSDNGLLNDRFAASANPPMVISTSAAASLAGSTLTWTEIRP